MFKFLTRQVATKTGKWGILGAVGAWVGVATGHVDVNTALELTSISGGIMFLRDKQAKQDLEERRR